MNLFTDNCVPRTIILADQQKTSDTLDRFFRPVHILDALTTEMIGYENLQTYGNTMKVGTYRTRNTA